MFFFFQAEDGIRDPLVTGVQTCALPILLTKDPSAGFSFARPCLTGVNENPAEGSFVSRSRLTAPAPRLATDQTRSEERRVGKECRSGGWPDQLKKKEMKRCDADGGTVRL